MVLITASFLTGSYSVSNRHIDEPSPLPGAVLAPSRYTRRSFPCVSITHHGPYHCLVPDWLLLGIEPTYRRTLTLAWRRAGSIPLHPALIPLRFHHPSWSLSLPRS